MKNYKYNFNNGCNFIIDWFCNDKGWLCIVDDVNLAALYVVNLKVQEICIWLMIMIEAISISKKVQVL